MAGSGKGCAGGGLVGRPTPAESLLGGVSGCRAPGVFCVLANLRVLVVKVDIAVLKQELALLLSIGIEHKAAGGCVSSQEATVSLGRFEGAAREVAAAGARAARVGQGGARAGAVLGFASCLKGGGLACWGRLPGHLT